MNTNKAVVSLPLKFGENAAIGEALKRFSLAVEAAPSKITDYKSINYWVTPETEEETKAYIKYCIDLGGTLIFDGSNYVDIKFKAENLTCTIYVYTSKLKITEEVVPQPAKTVKKIVDFPELEAALSASKPKV